MALESGTKLGHYEVTDLLGKGGMGEVYRARDTKLGREVAIKVLPSEFSQDGERLARLEREARMLAALNHPNIAAIYGLEEHEGTRFLVLELVEGETLADRIHRGAVAVEEALRLALQISEALEAAHDKAVIHRDLKPANIKINREATVKVLDFGLAKASERDVVEPSGSNSPTLSMAATQQGVILGTASYMSPEQAKGRLVDRQSDVWSFGCVLYELLTGKPAFPGEDVSEILGSVLKLDPAWDDLPRNLHPRLSELLERCLDKNVRSRYHDIADVRTEIERILAHPGGVVSSAGPTRGRLIAYSAVGAGTVVAIIAGVFMAFGPSVVPEVPGWASDPIRFDVDSPDNVTFAPGPAVPFAVSPDGSMIVFAGRASDGTEQLWLRALSSAAARPIPGTEGGHSPFWSPTSDAVGFFTATALMRVSVAGGGPATITRLARRTLYNIDAATWGTGDVIVFQTRTGSPLSQVSVQSGSVRPATTYEPQDAIHLWPEFLPDGQRFFYISTQGLHMASIDGDDQVVLPASSDLWPDFTGSGNVMRYTPGYLLFRLDRGLSAIPFDGGTLDLSREPFRLLDRIPRSGAGAVPYSVSQNGVLVYWTRPDQEPAEFRWIDRDGSMSQPLTVPAVYTGFDLAPDGDRLAFSRNGDDGRRDVWVLRFANGSEERITLDGDSMTPLWSLDGRTLGFSSARANPPDLYRYVFASGIRESLYESTAATYPNAWEPGGGTMVFTREDGAGADIWRLDLDSLEAEPLPLDIGSNREGNGDVSTDGRWIAYETDASGEFEVVVAGYPSGQPRRTVSIGGGRWPQWQVEGEGLYYMSPENDLMEVRLTLDGSTFEATAPETLFSVPRVIAENPADGPFVAAPDGRRFLFLIRPEEDVDPEPIHVIANWTALIDHDDE